MSGPPDAEACPRGQQVPLERSAALWPLWQALHRPGGQERAVRLLRLWHPAPGGRWRLPSPLPQRTRVEGFVVDKIKERILTDETITELVTLVAEEVDAMAGEFAGRLKVIEAELADVVSRLERLYEALETIKDSRFL